MSESQCYLWAIGIIYWYKRKGKYHLSPKLPKLPFESWGCFYIFDKRFDQIQLRRKKPKKGKSSYEWLTRDQIIKHLQSGDQGG